MSEKITVVDMIKAHDGAGSGLDADTLDGIEGSQFVKSDSNKVLHSDALRISGSTLYLYKGDGSNESVSLPLSNNINGVGSYRLVITKPDWGSYVEGDTVSGSYLRTSSAEIDNTNGATPVLRSGSSLSGTWKVLSPRVARDALGLVVRIS